MTAWAEGSDPDGDRLRWRWVLLQESGNYMVIGTGEPMPRGFPEAIVEGQESAPVRVRLTGATCLEFYARGEKGGERVSFKVGNIEKGKYPDSDRAELKDVRLRPEWTRYRVPLDGRDLSQIKTGFGWVLGGQGAPVVFYLSGMRFIRE